MNFQDLTESFDCLFPVSGLFISMIFGFTFQLDFNSEFLSVYWFGSSEAFLCFVFISEEQTLLAQILGNIYSHSCFSLSSSLISAPDLNLQGPSGNMKKANIGQGKPTVQILTPDEFNLEILVKDSASLQSCTLISCLADGNKSRGRNIYTE